MAKRDKTRVISFPHVHKKALDVMQDKLCASIHIGFFDLTAEMLNTKTFIESTSRTISFHQNPQFSIVFLKGDNYIQTVKVEY